MDEERRLCYVGMTRARSQLVLTGAARRRVFGEYQSMEPSRFMDEVPPQLVERIEPAYPDEQLSELVRRRLRPFELVRPRSHELYVSPAAPGRFRPEPREQPAYAYEDEDQSVAAGPAPRRKGASSAVRRRNDSQRRRAGGRREAGGEVHGGAEDAAREVREAGDGLARALSGLGSGVRG